MYVPFLSLKREYYYLRDEIDAAIRDVIEGGQFILGRNVELFEREFSAYVGGKYCVGVGSGTDALFLALNVLNLPRGSEVITQSFTFVSVADAIVRNGLRPRFCDINLSTFNMEPDGIKGLITDRTRAIIVQHMYGLPSRIEEIREIAEDYGLWLIEDCSHAHGAKYKGRVVGSFGDLSCFSFYPAKILGAYGDAGAVLTNDYELAEGLRMLRNYGQRVKYYHDLIGYNSRLDEIQAAVLRVKLRYLDEFVLRRRRFAGVYNDLLGKVVEMQNEYENAYHAYGYFVIRGKNRDELYKFLRERGVETIIHYPLPIHKQKSYSEFNSMTLVESERAAGEVLSLPMHPFLNEEEINYVAESVIKFYS